MANRKKDWGLKEKITFVIVMIVLYRIGVSVPIPFIDAANFESFVTTPSVNNLLYATTMMGGSLTQLGVLSLGVMPFITASIIMQLLKVVVPTIDEMYKNDADRQKLTQWTRYLTVFLATTQSLGIVVGAPALMGFDVFVTDSVWAKVLGIFTMVIGAVLAMRIGEEITLRGIGNGTSLVIFTSILVTLPGLIIQTYNSQGIEMALAFGGLLIAALGIILWVEKSELRVPIVYTKSSHNVSRSTQASMLPIKVAIAGVLPVIFASTLTMLPTMVSQFYTKPWMLEIANYMVYGSIPFIAVFALLTIVFTFFSIKMVFDIDRIATELRAQGGFIDGQRPGDETKKHLRTLGNRMAVLDSIYLTVISIATFIALPLLGITNNTFAVTSLVILGTVVTTFIAAVDSERFKGKHESMLY